MSSIAQSPSSSHLITFGAMTCTESCVATLLNMTGFDYRYFFLDYWNLSYESHTLLAGRNIRVIDLKYLFGIRKKSLESESLEACAGLVSEANKYALLLTQASKLPYFPHKLLSFEGNGFDHYILIHGFDKGHFLVTDPIAEFVGWVPQEQLIDSSPYPNRFRLWELRYAADFQTPNAWKLLRRVSKQNYLRSIMSQKSYDLMRQDVDDFPNFSAEERNHWIKLNSVAITTIIKNRRLIWRSFSTLNLLASELIAELEPLINMIIPLWTQLNLLLIKLMKYESAPFLIDSIRNKVDAIQKAESDFVTAMYKTERWVS